MRGTGIGTEVVSTRRRGAGSQDLRATVEGIAIGRGIRTEAESGTRNVTVIGTGCPNAMMDIDVTTVAEVVVVVCRKVAAEGCEDPTAARWIGRWPKEWEWDIILDLASSNS